MLSTKSVSSKILSLLALSLTCCGPLPNSATLTDSNDRYIVVLKKSVAQAALDRVSARANVSAGTTSSGQAVVNGLMRGIEARHTLGPAEKQFHTALQGGVYRLSPEQAVDLATDAQIAYIEKDLKVSIETAQSDVTWGLDRLDQTDLPLNSTYNYPTGTATVHAYVIDTGILTTHQDFQGRADSGTDIVDGDSDATDCNGHGTHVAGTIGSGTYGVAKSVRLHAVRVLDCSGSGSFSDVVAGIDWVAAHHVKPAVANMSLGGGASQAIDDAVSAAIQAGVTFVVAAGNNSSLACDGSPARVPQAITVGSTTNADARSSFSNYGSCVDIFAPGSDIKSLWFSSNTATNTISGTSMASPHVAGVVALYLAQHPSASPAEVSRRVIAGAISGKLTGIGSGSPNLLANINFISTGSPPPLNPTPPPAPPPRPTPVPTPDPGAPCLGAGCSHYSGSLKGKGSYNYKPAELLSSAGQMHFWLSGPSDSDFDIYLYKKIGSGWSLVAMANGSGSDEKIVYLASSGTYRIKVVSYFGSGAYELYAKVPLP